ncbi:MAG: hypothetical protein KatS3mg102_0295 [Planctomycetota bacterium]|nr:MAG: hypothetical protein KatS3mg102_0295 [Planctomycetota bacterium]
MDKPAPADHPIHELIRRRWSPRAFADRPVAPELLRSLFEAARWAASSYNEQPWRYIVAPREDQQTYGKLLDCLVPGNQRWARHAPVLALSVARLRFTHNDRPNRHAWHDVGAASALLALEATARGLAIHQMAGFEAERARQAFGIPQEFDPVAAIALGYPGDPQALPEDLRERELAPRQRRPLAETVFGGRWGEPLALLHLD